MPVCEEHKIVNMIGVCLDTTHHHQQVQPLHLPAVRLRAGAGGGLRALPGQQDGQEVAHRLRRLRLGPVDHATPTPSEIKKAGGEVVGTTGIPLGTADMTPFLSKITGDFDGLFGIFFGKDGVTIGNQAYDLGLTKKYKWAGDGAIAESTNLPGARQQDRRLRRHQPLHAGARRPAQHARAQEVLRRGGGAAEADRPVGAAARPLRAVELRGDERPQDRHGEVGLPGPRGHA